MHTRKIILSLGFTAYLVLTLTVTVWAQGADKAGSSKAASGSPAVDQDAENLAERQRILREGLLKDAADKQQEGRKLLARKKYREAIAVLEQALSMLPTGPKVEPFEKSIRADIADAYATMADERGNQLMELPLTQRNWDEPIAWAKKALEYNPEDKHIRELLVDLEVAKQRNPPPIVRREARSDETPQRKEQRVTLSEKLRAARIQLEAGYLDEAEATLNEILLEDKYNIAAYHYLRKVHEQRTVVDEYRRKMAASRYLEEIDRRWAPRIEKPPVGPKGKEPTEVIEKKDPLKPIMDRLNNIVIDEIDFREAEIGKVIEYLTDESRRKDPTGVGVNFILREPPEGGRTIKSLRLRKVKLIDVLRIITDLVEMRFVPEENAVVIVKRDSDYGRRMETRTYPVDPALLLKIIIPGGGGMGGGGVPLPDGGGGVPPIGGIGGGGGGGMVVEPQQIVQFFIDLGVLFPPGSNARYLVPISRLVVTNTRENLEALEKILADLQVGQNQVEIETKFLEVGESALRELGFQWYLGEFAMSRVTRNGRATDQVVMNPAQASWKPSVIPPGRIEHGFTPQGTPTVTGSGSIEIGGNPFTPGAQTNAFTGGLRDLSVVSIGAIESLLGGAASVVNNELFSIGGVLTKPQFQVIVNALSRSQRSDLLSAPRITTVLGQPATIKIVTEFIYPTRWREPQAVAAAGGVQGSAGVAVTPSTPQSFATREVGVLLTVTPILGADGYTINLALNPEVSEFLGFVDYGGKIQIPAAGAPQGFVEVDNKLPQPIFATRSLLTNVAIWDGQTVVMGGLAREDVTEINDKVPFFGDIPFVGRLFRSKGKSIGKRNLIIFVTATLIDPAGNRVHPEGSAGATYTPPVPAPQPGVPPVPLP